MIKKILKTVRGFSPVELVIMVGFAALAAGALIFLATTPHYMAQQPVDINIKVEGAATVSKGAVATTSKTESRYSAAKAEEAAVTSTDTIADPALEMVDTTPANNTPKGKMIGKINPDPGHLKNSVGTPALPGDTEIRVYPRGQFKEQPRTGEYSDALNVQWAVDNVADNGTVRLMTTDPNGSTLKVFYFGEPDADAGYVEIQTQGVKIVGEKLANSVTADKWTESDSANRTFELPQGASMKSDRAVIYGGGTAALDGIGTINTLPSSTYDFTVQGIRFEKSGTAVYARASGPTGITLNDNVVANIFPAPVSIRGFSLSASALGIIKGDTYITNNKIIINDPNYNGMVFAIHTVYPGKLHANNNVVTGDANPLRRNYGIYLVYPDAYSEFRGNTVSLNGAYYGLACGTNGAGAGKYKVIDSNTVTGNNVTLGLVLMDLNASTVTNNTVDVTLNSFNDTLPGALKTGAYAAILSSSRDCTVENNSFSSTHDPSLGNPANIYASIVFGKFMPYGVKNLILRNNKISGNGTMIIHGGFVRDGTVTSTIEGNDMSGFTVNTTGQGGIVCAGQSNTIKNNTYPAAANAPIAISLLAPSGYNTVYEPNLACSRITNLGTSNTITCM